VAYDSSRSLVPTDTCPNLLVSRLAVNGLARVLPGDPNNIREWPSPDSERLGAIPSGEVLEVLDGPVCGGDLVWWQVHFGDLIGWTAEGEGDRYWLEPLR
jgi:hypothetical protein